MTMATEMYKSELYYVQITPSRIETESTYHHEWNGRDSDDLCDWNDYYSKKETKYHRVNVRPANMESLRSAIDARKAELEDIAKQHLGLRVDPRWCGVFANTIEWGDSIESDFEITESDFEDFKCDVYNAIIVVHRGIRGKYITKVIKVYNDNYMSGLLINESIDIIREGYFSETDDIRKEYVLALDVQDIVCGDTLDERYSIENI